VSAHPRRKISYWNMRDRDAKKLRTPEDRMQRDETAVTPSNYSKPAQVCIRNDITQKLSRQQDIIHLLPAIIDQVVELFSVSGTATILGRDYDLAVPLD
jgi:hypothetical protein